MNERDRIQGRLLVIAGLFLFVYSLLLTLAPAARLRSWQELAVLDYHLGQWVIFAFWAGLFTLAHRQTIQHLPERDPYLLPVAALLSGWGLLVVYRLYPSLGVKQGLWLLVIGALLILGLRLPHQLSFLRRFKYLWLTGGLVLTGLTLFFGTNPLGFGPRLWLGCCDLYFQPSEPLKLLLVVYLAAYLADRLPRVYALAPKKVTGMHQAAPLLSTLRTWLISPPLLPLLAPTLVLTGLAIALLVAQHDLGTASIFILLYATIVYVATGRQRILWVSGTLLVLAGLAGYQLFDVVRLRIEAWINPWLDPSGRSYQIVQSLLAVANGGIFGRGPGMGSPSLVPIAHSDFIFAAIAEESGVLGVVALLVLLGLLVGRGVRAALHAPDPFRHYLATGLTAHLGVQSILIIGGNLRLLPLTGVTLPFVSYGGSSLLTSFLSLLLLMHIGAGAAYGVPARVNPTPYRQLASALVAGLALISLGVGWWGIYRGPVLLTRTDNPRRAIDDRYVYRGALLDHADLPLSRDSGSPGTYQRIYLYPDLGPILGYTHPIYGQSGLEASLDEVLRGLQGNPVLSIWWNHLIYGQPPPGLDVRLSLDLRLQAKADELLKDQRGALVLLDSNSGHILAMASHPTFNANYLERDWVTLVKDESAPLVNRATQGSYPVGSAIGPLLLSAFLAQGDPLPALPSLLAYSIDGVSLDCALSTTIEQIGAARSTQEDWGATVAAGCPAPLATLVREGERSGPRRIRSILLQEAGLNIAPTLGLPVAGNKPPVSIKTNLVQALLGPKGIQTSPLQMALAIAALNNSGIRPAPRLILEMKTPEQGWVELLKQGKDTAFLSADAAARAADMLSQEGLPIWQAVADMRSGKSGVTWYLGGTLPGRQTFPLTLVVLLEEDDPILAIKIGQEVLQTAINSFTTE